MHHHAELLTRAWWQSHKERILAGEVEDVFPYPQHIRFCQQNPSVPANPSPLSPHSSHYLETLHNE
jgi:isocitrate dehydrogenase kinase/phosphatase